MRTYTHGAIGYVLYARGSADARKLAAVGAMLPDLLLAVGYVFHLQYMPPDVAWLEAGHGLFHRTLHPITEAMHSLLLSVPAAGLVWIVRRGATPLVVGMISHGVVDLLTHVDAAYNHLYPLPLEPIVAPVSYTSTWFTLLEHAMFAAFVIWYLRGREVDARKPVKATEGTA